MSQLTNNEISVLVTMRTAWHLIGSMAGQTEIAHHAGISLGDCKRAIRSLVDRGLVVMLPDGGWAPTNA